MTSFYDWYADLPVASPQVFGDQTDVPESGDWWDAVLPDDVGLQRPGHPHARRALDGRGPLPRNESRHGQPRLRRQHQVRRRVDAVRAGHRRRAGDGDGARHPVRIPRRTSGFRSSSTTSGSTPTCRSWSSSRNATARYVPGKNLTAADLGDDVEGAAFKPVLLDGRDRRPSRCPNGSLGFRYTDDGVGKWNLDLGDIVPALTVLGDAGGQTALVQLARFDTLDGHGEMLHARCAGPAGRRAPVLHGVRPDAGPVRGAPARAAGRPGPPATTTPSEPYTPAWQEPITGVSRRAGRPDRPGVRPQRRGIRRPLDDHHGRRDLPVVPRRRHLPRGAGAAAADRVDGPQRRRLGALRRPGEVPAGHRVGDDGDGPPTGAGRRGR